MIRLGTFTRTKNGFFGQITTFLMEDDLSILPIEDPATENTPDYRVLRGLEDDAIQVGCAWARQGERISTSARILSNAVECCFHAGAVIADRRAGPGGGRKGGQARLEAGNHRIRQCDIRGAHCGRYERNTNRGVGKRQDGVSVIDDFSHVQGKCGGRAALGRGAGCQQASRQRSGPGTHQGPAGNVRVHNMSLLIGQETFVGSGLATRFTPIS